MLARHDEELLCHFPHYFNPQRHAATLNVISPNNSRDFAAKGFGYSAMGPISSSISISNFIRVVNC
jgi:hypothetical protein